MSSHLPVYRLYGDDAGLADVMHCESIAERSRLHSWEISAHRHGALYQTFLIERGRVEAELDGAPSACRGPCVITVVPPAVHAFRWSTDVRGTVFTVVEAHMRQLLESEPAVREALMQTRIVKLGAPQRDELLPVARRLAAEHQGHGLGRALAVDAALGTWFVALARCLPDAPAGRSPAGARLQGHVQRFRDLVDERFREQPPLAAFAAPLGITTTQLNRACQTVLKQSALSVLHGRLCHEAKRELAYTTMSIKHIALRLGFSDPAYFTRFFERETGHSPSAWRAAVRSP